MNPKLLFLFIITLGVLNPLPAQDLAPIVSPPDYDNNTFGYNGSPIEFNGLLCLRYRKNNGNNVLFTFDGSQLSEIPSPANYDGNGGGYAVLTPSSWPELKPVVWNDKLYLGYHNNVEWLSFTLFEFDGNTLSPIPNPIGYNEGRSGIRAIITSTTDAMYLVYRTDNDGERVLFKYDGSNLTVIPNPPGYDATPDSPGNGLLAFPSNIDSYFKEIPIIGNTMFLQYSGEDYISDLTLFNLGTDELTPYRGEGYDGVNKGLLGYPMIIDEVPYFKYINNEGIFKLVKFENNTLVTLDFPSGYSNEYSGYLGDPIIVDNQLYIRTQKDNGSYQLLVSDGSQLTEIAPADPAYHEDHYGYMGDPIVFNNNLYLRYFESTDNTYRLFKLEGTLLSEIELPPNFGFFGRGYYGDPILFDNAVYLKYFNYYGVYTLYKYDGNTLTEIPTPEGFNDFGKGYTGEAYVVGSDLFLVYNSNTDSRVLFTYDGSTLQEIASPEGYETYGFIDNFHVFNDKLYLRYRHDSGKYDLMEYSGLSLDIDEVSAKPNVSLYPNPVQDVFNLKFMGTADIKAMTLVDLNGRIVTTFDSLHAGNQYRLGDLAEGMYFLHLVYHDKTAQTLKLIKMK